MNGTTAQPAARNSAIDILRFLACYLVIQSHVGEFFYIAPDMSVLHGPGTFAAMIYNSLCRCSVPLFVAISGFCILPVKVSTSQFLKRRFTRVAIPFVLWCIVYAFYQFFTEKIALSVVFGHIAKIPVNYGTEIGHLWYVYMLLGIYLFAPIISPWLEKASKGSIEFYLALWAVTCFLPYIHLVFPEVWGECFWNTTPMLHYFSGFLGYAVLGFYIKRFYAGKSKWDLPAGFLLTAVGYAATALIFAHQLGAVKMVPDVELSWGFSTINVALMTAGIFLMVKNIRFKNSGAWYARCITDVSLQTYGIYLVHIIVLNTVYQYLHGTFTNEFLNMPLMGVITYAGSYVVIKLISYIPKSKYLIG
jgi:surface polysaccharide O-acyltransferase-like enzyme